MLERIGEINAGFLGIFSVDTGNHPRYRSSTVSHPWSMQMSVNDWLGWHVKDKFTKYEGIVSAVTNYLYSGPRVAVHTTMENVSRDHDLGRYFDIPQLEKIGEVAEFEPVPTPPSTITLGEYVGDKITKYNGVAIAETTWIWGCRKIEVQTPERHEGLPVASKTFDEGRLLVIPPAALKSAAEAVENAPTPTERGGPADEPDRGADPEWR